MCGRFVSSSAPERIAAYFGAESTVESLGENFNVAPTNDIYGVVADPDGHLELQVFHWGLIPVWAKERKIGQRMINARAETLAEKPAFKGVFKKHRCIIPMDGFYEWAPGVPDGPGHEGRQARQAPAFHPTCRRRAAGGRRPVVGVARQIGGARRAVAAQRHRGHHSAPTAR